jgi:hypothetical protein
MVKADTILDFYFKENRSVLKRFSPEMFQDKLEYICSEITFLTNL